MPVGGAQRWRLGLVVATAGLLAVVAVSADGSPLRAPRSPVSDQSNTSPGWLQALLLVPILAGLAVAIWSAISIARHGKPGGLVLRRRSLLRSVLLMVALALLLAAVANRPDGDGAQDVPPLTTTETDEPASGDDGSARSAWPVALILGGAAAILLASALRSRQRRATPDADDVAAAPTAADVFDDSVLSRLDEPDPRTAVIAAYAALLQRLQACGCGRAESETPEEHLHRALATLDVAPGPLQEIVDLYVEARYSTHALGPEQRDRARRAFTAAAASLESTS